MKNIKKILAALFLGFLAFAPPGTLIFIAFVVLGLLGKKWFIAGIIAALILLPVCFFVFRSRLTESYFLSGIFRKIKK